MVPPLYRCKPTGHDDFHYHLPLHAVYLTEELSIFVDSVRWSYHPEEISFHLSLTSRPQNSSIISSLSVIVVFVIFNTAWQELLSIETEAASSMDSGVQLWPFIFILHAGIYMAAQWCCSENEGVCVWSRVLYVYASLWWRHMCGPLKDNMATSLGSIRTCHKEVQYWPFTRPIDQLLLEPTMLDNARLASSSSISIPLCGTVLAVTPYGSIYMLYQGAAFLYRQCWMESEISLQQCTGHRFPHVIFL